MLMATFEDLVSVYLKSSLGSYVNLSNLHQRLCIMPSRSQQHFDERTGMPSREASTVVPSASDDLKELNLQTFKNVHKIHKLMRIIQGSPGEAVFSEQISLGCFMSA